MEKTLDTRNGAVYRGDQRSKQARRGGVVVDDPDPNLPEGDDSDRSLSLVRPVPPAANFLATRIWMLAGVLTVECVAFSRLPHRWITGELTPLPVAFGIALLLFGHNRLLRIKSYRSPPIDRKLLALHVFAIAATVLANIALAYSWSTNVNVILTLIAVWSSSLLVLILSLASALFPLRQWILLIRSLGSAWAYAALATLVAIAARSRVRIAWDAPQSSFGSFLQRATFAGVRAILHIFYAKVVSYPAGNVVGTSRFAVRIEGGCSGIEGVTLMLALTLIWLFFVRRELRLKRAIWLVPIALTAVWIFNLARIAVLVAIGDAGRPDIALSGFHADAGWILFNIIAIGFLLAAQHLRWLRRDSSAPLYLADVNTSRPSAVAVYLSPLLAIVAASLVSQVFSSGFETLYPLRFVAALLVLWYFRAEYRRLDWKFGWAGPLAGVLVFALWLFPSRGSVAGANTLAQHLAQLALWQRVAWLAVRCAALAVTVPIAEELAFRGYLARRIMAPEIETVTFAELSPVAILVSSVAFGLLHGQMWLHGIIAGVVFALVAKLRGRFGDAVAAHVTVNLLLAIWGITKGDYSKW